jgi:hypothetical protein
MSEDRRIFSEQETAALVRRAVELQEQAKDAGGYTPGVTEEELRRIAGELGLGSKYLEQAMREGVTPEGKKGPFHFTEEFERVLDVELKPEDFDLLMGELRHVGRRNPITQVGRTLTGQTWTGISVAGVDVSSRNGRTKIKVKSNGVIAWLFTIHPATLACFILLPIMGAQGLILPAIGAAVGLGALALAGFNWFLRKGHEAARRLTDRLAAAVSEADPSLRENLAHSSAPVPEKPIEQQVQS